MTWHCTRSRRTRGAHRNVCKGIVRKEQGKKGKKMGLSDLSGGAAARMCLRGILRITAVLALTCACASASAEEPAENRFDAIIGATAARHNVDPLLIKAMVWHESRFRPLAQGKDGEIGLMQVKMDVVRDWARARGVKTPRRADVFDPYVNIEIGTWYFARAFRKWSRSSHALLLALGEYNAGPGRVRRWIRRYGGNRELAISRSASSHYVRAIRDKYLAYTVQFAAAVAASSDAGQRPLPQPAPPDASAL